VVEKHIKPTPEEWNSYNRIYTSEVIINEPPINLEDGCLVKLLTKKKKYKKGGKKN
jgi:hypothetical protein